MGSIAVATLLMLSIFVWNVFPVCYIPDVGMTPFKKVSEYIISLLFLGSAVWIYQNREYYEDTVRKLLLGSLALMIGAELAFTRVCRRLLLTLPT